MRVKLSGIVTAVSKQSDYYPKKGEYIVSKIKIQENERNISGEISIRENLPLDETVTIYLDTTVSNKVVQEIESSELPEHVENIEIISKVVNT